MAGWSRSSCFVESWWWVAPAAAGAGAAWRTRAVTAETVAARAGSNSTPRGTRSAVAYRGAHRGARRDVARRPGRTCSAAQGSRLPRSAPRGSAPGHREAKRAAAGRRSARAKSASLEAAGERARACRRRDRAVPRGALADDPLPIERLVAAHDAVTARWLAYETDVGEGARVPADDSTPSIRRPWPSSAPSARRSSCVPPLPERASRRSSSSPTATRCARSKPRSTRPSAQAGVAARSSLTGARRPPTVIWPRAAAPRSSRRRLPTLTHVSRPPPGDRLPWQGPRAPRPAAARRLA